MTKSHPGVCSFVAPRTHPKVVPWHETIALFPSCPMIQQWALKVYTDQEDGVLSTAAAIQLADGTNKNEPGVGRSDSCVDGCFTFVHQQDIFAAQDGTMSTRIHMSYPHIRTYICCSYISYYIRLYLQYTYIYVHGWQVIIVRNTRTE